MRYNEQDIKEFTIHPNELINLRLIQKSKNSYSSLVFIVRNHSKVKQGKARMLVNHKQLN